MKIIQVSVGSVRMPPNEGWAQMQVMINASKHLAKMGHHVVILDRKYKKDDMDVDHVEDLEIVRLNVFQFPLGKARGVVRFVLAELNAVIFALAVSSYLRKNGSNIDIIQLHITSIGLIVSILNRKLRRKMVYACHLGHWGLAKERLVILERIHLFVDPYLMRRVGKVIALNDAAKESFVSKGKINADNVVVVSNGVDTDFFRPNNEAREAIKEKYRLEAKTTVLFVGRLVRIKGVEQFLRAADMVINEFGYRDTSFVLVGPATFVATEEPISMEEVLSFLRQHQLQKHVILTGSLPLEEVRMMHAASDIFVLPSLAEGDPLVTLEAMASGLPIVATRVGGIPNQIRDGWNGFLIDPGDEQQLAERIAYLLDNPEERGRMARNSRKYAEEEFDWGMIAKKILAVYQKVQN